MYADTDRPGFNKTYHYQFDCCQGGRGGAGYLGDLCADEVQSTLTINGAEGSYGSTISSYSITGGGYTSTASSFTTGSLNTSGMVTFTATVTDSRGRVSAVATVSISVVAYSPPSFASYLSQRCLSKDC